MNPDFYWNGDDGWETECVIINGQVYRGDNTSDLLDIISKLEEV